MTAPRPARPGRLNKVLSTATPGSRRRLLIALGAMAVLLVLVINALFQGAGSYTRIPKEVRIKYVPADFKPQIDEEKALEILANPYKYSREFNQLIYDFNLSLLNHVANRMDLSDSLRTAIRTEYDKHHPYIRRMYFNDFVALQDTSSALYQQWYQSGNADAVTVLNEVASKYTCFMINLVLASVLETEEGKIAVYGNKADTPCGVAMMEGLNPMIERLKERATIRDFSQSKGFLEEKVETVIAELATLEIRDKKGLNKQMQTKIWGFSVSSTELEVTAVSVLKIGFDLQKFLNISLDAPAKILTITLPEPEILSHEVYPRIDKLDIGWLREVESADFNKNFNLLRKEFRREALESDAMDKAKTQANEVIQMLFGPLMKSIGRQYTLQVRFKNVNTAIEEDWEEDL